MILGTASDGEYRTEIQSDRLQKTRILADRIRRMCEADLECRRLAPAWKLVTIVWNNALSFDCCVVPPGALASYAQELVEIVDALLPCLWDKTDLSTLPSKECAFPGTKEDLTQALLRSPMAFLEQYLALAPSVVKSTGQQAIRTLGLACELRVKDRDRDSEGTKLLRDLVAKAAANGQCSPHAVLSEDGGPSWSECC